MNPKIPLRPPKQSKRSRRARDKASNYRGFYAVREAGELAAVSVAPAIANAVYHATGKRVRDLPITAEKLL
jgi:CO/xanthine dehydrogenase Mo-binding subunit